MLTVIVGAEGAEESKAFTVHKDSLCANSSFFASATSGYWIESAEKLVRLPSVEPRVFDAYVHWTYTSKIDLSGTCQQHKACNHKPSYLPLAKLWVLGDMLLDHKLCNRVTAKIWSKFDDVKDLHVPSLPAMCYVFENTSADSPLRRLFTDMWVLQPDSDFFIENEKALPQELIVELARRFLECGPVEAVQDVATYYVEE